MSLQTKVKKLSDYIVFLFILKGWKVFCTEKYRLLRKPMGFLAAWYRRLIIPKTKLIIVIGSLGKTTTTTVLRSTILEKARKQSPGNFGCFLCENILRCRPKDKFGVVEVAVNGPNQMRRYAGMIRPDIVVVTSIASDHRRSFPTLEDTRNEKVVMVRALGPDGIAVLNGDDPNVRWMASQTNAQVITFGMNDNNHVRATDIHVDWPNGTRFKFHANGQAHNVFIPLLGQHMVCAALAALAVGVITGIDLDNIVQRLAGIEQTKEGMERIFLKNNVILINDTKKASLESYYAAFHVLSGINAKRKLLVLGDIEDPPSKAGDAYRDLGQRLGTFADKLFFVGSHNFGKMKTGAAEAGMNRDALIYADSRVNKAAELLKDELKEGDVVLIKGRSSQRFSRIALSLMEKKVHCNVKYCDLKIMYCDWCPLLDKEGKAFKNRYVEMFVRE